MKGQRRNRDERRLLRMEQCLNQDIKDKYKFFRWRDGKSGPKGSKQRKLCGKDLEVRRDGDSENVSGVWL